MELVSIGRKEVEIDLFDSPGGKVKLYSSLTVEKQTQISTKFGKKEDPDTQASVACETIIACFIDWNIGKDNVKLECTQETLKQFSHRDFFAMLQACTGQRLLDEEGNMLSKEEIEKKGKSA